MNIYSRVMSFSVLSLVLLLAIKANEDLKRMYPLRCSYTKNIFCECGKIGHIFSLSIDACRFDIFGQICGECVSKELSSKVCENFYSCHECGTSLDECLGCSTGKNSRFCKEDVPLGNNKEELKQLSKRQVQGPEVCGVIPAPKPGKVSCTVSPGTITCIGTCDSGYQFNDGSFQKVHKCTDIDGLWSPMKIFPPCKALCTKQCENGGRCGAHNICICGNDYRGDSCQYPLALCNLEKTDSPSSWQCSHTHVSSTCRIACFPPGSVEAEMNFQTHVCSLQGTWDPPLPTCVKGMVRVQCPDPGHVSNGQRESHTDIFPVGTLVSFVCEDNYILRGESTISCLSSGKWSAEKPICYQSKAFCPQPIVPENAQVFLFIPGLSFHHGSTDYERGEIPIKLNRGFISPEEESFDAPTSPGSLSIGSRVQYKCNSRFYQLYGSEYQTCLRSGSWSGYQPTCIPQCGISDSPRTPFITNGNLTEKGQWPWQVAIAVWVDEETRWQLICGASLLNERWVVTAAHCVTREHSNTPTDPKTLALFLGKHSRSFEKDDKYVQKRKIAQIVVHKDYDFTKFDTDVALLQLETPAELTSRVQPICLPSEESTRENIRDGKLGVVTGWGVTEHHRYSEILRQSVLPVVSHWRCEQGYRESLRTITVTKNMFCAGYGEGHVDTCSGDSGGPMMFLDEAQRPKRWILEGIVSWGSGFGCGKANHYAGFTKVKAFTSWINMHI